MEGHSAPSARPATAASGERLHPAQSVDASATQSPLPSPGPQYATYPPTPGTNGEGVPYYMPTGPDERTPLAEKDQPWPPESIVPDVPQEPPVVVAPWIPLPLRKWFWIPLVVLMAGGGIAFEVALHFSKTRQGWATKGNFNSEGGFLHYVYTFPPVAVSMLFAALWTWTDLEIRRLQPYVDLARGNSPPQRSLLLDYTRTHTFVVWTVAAKNRHWMVTLASLLVLITFFFQPLAAALFNVQDVWWLEPRSTATNLGVIALNQDSNFQDLTSFLTAAGYASADVLYNIGDPSFVHQGYTIAPIDLPNVSNGTVYANTTAVLSKPTCVQPDAGSLQMINMTDIVGIGAWNNSASFQGCTFSWSVNKTAEHLFGVDLVTDTSSPSCTAFQSLPEQFSPVIFWFFTYLPKPMASLTLCTPAITLLDAAVSIDLASRNLSSVTPLGPLGSRNGTDAALAQFAGNVSGAPLDGQAYNGMFFDFVSAGASDPFVLSRQDAIRLALPAAVFQSAEAGNLTEAFVQNSFAGLSERVYTMYLALVAKTVYFVDHSETIPIDMRTIHKRLFLSPVATHLLASAMFVLAVFGTVLQICHRRERSVLSLAHAPGTIASAVSLGGHSGLGNVLAGRHKLEDMKAALENKRFRIDRRTMKIVVEGEEGYEEAVSPPWARATFEAGKRMSANLMGRMRTGTSGSRGV